MNKGDKIVKSKNCLEGRQQPLTGSPRSRFSSMKKFSSMIFLTTFIDNREINNFGINTFKIMSSLCIGGVQAVMGANLSVML